MTQKDSFLLVLIAGPHRSGTADVPAMNAVALDVFRAGHVPVTGDAFTLPRADQVSNPIARWLLRRCDAVLRFGGPSRDADEVVALAREQGKPVFAGVEELP